VFAMAGNVIVLDRGADQISGSVQFLSGAMRHETAVKVCIKLTRSDNITPVATK